MSFHDIVDVLTEQHDEIRRLCTEVEQSRGDKRQRQFAELSRTVFRHERGEREIVHPAARNTTTRGNEIGRARQLEEGVIERSLTDLIDLGTGHPSFETRFHTLHRSILAHLTSEETDEFPLLRSHVPVQRLHMMVGALRDAAVLGAP